MLATVQIQFRTRGYIVDEVGRNDRGEWWVFTILESPGLKALGIEVAFIPDSLNPDGRSWTPANIRWGTDVAMYQGSAVPSPAKLADLIIAAIEADQPDA
ncbi:hypothetical protein PP713_07720 [Mycobacterium sp. CSUR Q5927]|nr:hypothetical protein [Mycobacterium sp. CSUR Q5927]